MAVIDRAGRSALTGAPISSAGSSPALSAMMVRYFANGRGDDCIGVIGAGITGVTTAYALSERGYDVTVFDQHRYSGMETSFANGGQLSASNAEVWNKSSTVVQGCAG